LIAAAHLRAFWYCAAVTAISALVSAGFSLAAVFARTPYDPTALYAASRSIALPIAVAVAIFRRSPISIAALAFVMGLVQLFDGFIGIYAHDASKTYGPFALSLLSFITLTRLLQVQPITGDLH
jgi:anti-sigma factor RsiW